LSRAREILDRVAEANTKPEGALEKAGYRYKYSEHSKNFNHCHWEHPSGQLAIAHFPYPPTPSFDYSVSHYRTKDDSFADKTTHGFDELTAYLRRQHK